MAIYMRQVDDQSATAGTGSQTLVGPAGQGAGGPGTYLGSVANNGDTCVLCFTDSAGNFEVSNCTVTITGAVVLVSRDTVIASSAALLAKASFVGVVRVTNYIPAPLNLVLFNLQYQVTAAAALAGIASDISDMKDAITLLVDGN